MNKPVCRCPHCDQASPIPPQEMMDLMEFEIRVVCTGCRKPSPPKDWMPTDD